MVPHRRYHRSFLSAVEDFLAVGEERYAPLVDWPADGAFAGLRFTLEDVRSPRTFADLVDLLAAQERPHAPRPPGRGASTERWIVAEDRFVGRISLRHDLDELLLTWGGHIGYVVRPSARRRGHATAALAAMLPLALERGLARVLVTCDEDNLGSRRVIEACGGRYEDSREGKRRYWVPTAATAATVPATPACPQT